MDRRRRARCQVRRRRVVDVKRQDLTTILVLITMGVAIASSGGNGKTVRDSVYGGAAGQVPDASASVISVFNKSQAPGMARSLTGLGQTNCAIGESADFPNTYLVTIISTIGEWMQFSIANGTVDMMSFKSGSDYNSALGGQSWSEFSANGTTCILGSDGTIS
jgi:hypothetical protein